MAGYVTYNGAAPTTAALVKVTTGTAIKTMLQLAPPSDMQIMITSWGFSLDAAPGGASVFELIQTDVAATVTAHVASGLVKLDPNAPNSRLTLGTSATGYTATAEGTTTASRLFDVKEVPSAAGTTDLTYSRIWVPDERPIVAVSTFLRVRATVATSATNMACWVTYFQL